MDLNITKRIQKLHLDKNIFMVVRYLKCKYDFFVPTLIKHGRLNYILTFFITDENALNFFFFNLANFNINIHSIYSD